MEEDVTNLRYKTNVAIVEIIGVSSRNCKNKHRVLLGRSAIKIDEIVQDFFMDLEDALDKVE
jgi:hypothetical protein